MRTVHRKNDKYRPKRSINAPTNYISSKSLSSLIKLADDWCERYGYEYEEPIYKVSVVDSRGQMYNTSYNPANTKKAKYEGTENYVSNYYEAKLRKVELV